MATPWGPPLKPSSASLKFRLAAYDAHWIVSPRIDQITRETGTVEKIDAEPEYTGQGIAAGSQVDAILIGAGIAGLWLLNLLTAKGYRVLLFEADSLGCQQTLGSQGMIHGGLKYALSGRLTGASEAIAGMPERWRHCLQGEDDVDLTGLTPVSDHYYLFAAAGSLGRLTSFFASRVLRGRIDKLAPKDYPDAFSGFSGIVYRLNDFVLDTEALITGLSRRLTDRIHPGSIDASMLEQTDTGWRLTLNGQVIDTTRLILTAGAGTGALLEGLGFAQPVMQLRPLHQVVVRHPRLEPVYAHCLTGITRSEPRLTITTHPDPKSGPVDRLWYLGGQLATDGVSRNRAGQIDHARRELEACVPWIDWNLAEFDTFLFERAEPAQTGGRRPDQAFVQEADGCLICWPTKLSLAPDLGDRVLARLPTPSGAPFVPLDLPTVPRGTLPWNR
jgi:glycine/D-amino acid oxidase-like deaminating enzyme